MPNRFSHLIPRIVLMDDAMDCLMSFSDFLFAFQIQFYYSGKYWEAAGFTLWHIITALQLFYPCSFFSLVRTCMGFHREYIANGTHQ